MAAGKIKKKGRGTLGVVAAILLLSAFVRLSEHAGQAFAKGAIEDEAMTASQSESKPNPDIARVLEALSLREARIEEGERQMRLRMIALQEAEVVLSNKLEQLKAAENSLRQTLALADQAAETDLLQLTSVYENMKPKDAAALFETMDPAFAAGFLGRMKPAAAAGILAGLTPDAAYAVSAILAGRNADVPTE